MIAMLHAPYIIGSYAITFGAIGFYAWRILGQARTSARHVPEEELPWK